MIRCFYRNPVVKLLWVCFVYWHSTLYDPEGSTHSFYDVFNVVNRNVIHTEFDKELILWQLSCNLRKSCDSWDEITDNMLGLLYVTLTLNSINQSCLAWCNKLLIEHLLLRSRSHNFFHAWTDDVPSKCWLVCCSFYIFWMKEVLVLVVGIRK